MKVFTLILAIGAAAISISGVIAKAVPQEGSYARFMDVLSQQC